MTKTISGVVQGVGEKYNGSVKVNNEWIAFKKGVANPAKVGDSVVLTLSPWSVNGKSGENITEIKIEAQKVVAEPSKPTEKDVAKPVSAGRDFDFENRGKVRHGLTVALVHMVAQQLITVEKLKEVVEELVPFVMGK